MHPIYESWLDGIESESIRKSVLSALLDCSPAHALMELVRNNGLNYMVAHGAYKNKFPKATNFAGWSLRGEEQNEYWHERQFDI